MAAKQSTPVDLERAIAELEALVEQMERGEITLEDSLKRFERGIELARRCQSALQLAEQKVEKLIEKSGVAQIVPLDRED